MGHFFPFGFLCDTLICPRGLLLGTFCLHVGQLWKKRRLTSPSCTRKRVPQCCPGASTWPVATWLVTCRWQYGHWYAYNCCIGLLLFCCCGTSAFVVTSSATLPLPPPLPPHCSTKWNVYQFYIFSAIPNFWTTAWTLRTKCYMTLIRSIAGELPILHRSPPFCLFQIVPSTPDPWRIQGLQHQITQPFGHASQYHDPNIKE